MYRILSYYLDFRKSTKTAVKAWFFKKCMNIDRMNIDSIIV